MYSSLLELEICHCTKDLLNLALISFRDERLKLELQVSVCIIITHIMLPALKLFILAASKQKKQNKGSQNQIISFC